MNGKTMDFPASFVFLVLIAVSSIDPGSCQDEDLREVYIFYNIMYVILPLLFAASAIITGIVISCYICNCCPVARRQRKEGEILSLPQHGAYFEAKKQSYHIIIPD